MADQVNNSVVAQRLQRQVLWVQTHSFLTSGLRSSHFMVRNTPACNSTCDEYAHKKTDLWSNSRLGSTSINQLCKLKQVTGLRPLPYSAIKYKSETRYLKLLQAIKHKTLRILLFLSFLDNKRILQLRFY